MTVFNNQCFQPFWGKCILNLTSDFIQNLTQKRLQTCLNTKAQTIKPPDLCCPAQQPLETCDYLNLNNFKLNKKFSSSTALGTFQMLSSLVWRVVTYRYRSFPTLKIWKFLSDRTILAENKGKSLHDLRIHKDFLDEAQKV